MSDQDARYWALAAVDSDIGAATGEATVVFTRRPKALEARQRVAYRSGLLVLVLSSFNQKAASLSSLHSIFWATRNDRTRRMFKSWWNGRRYLTTNTERSDPGLTLTLRLALADGLVTPLSKGERVKLTEKGQLLAEAILAEPHLMQAERAFLQELRPLSDAALARRMDGGAP